MQASRETSFVQASKPQCYIVDTVKASKPNRTTTKEDTSNTSYSNTINSNTVNSNAKKWQTISSNTTNTKKSNTTKSSATKSSATTSSVTRPNIKPTTKRVNAARAIAAAENMASTTKSNATKNTSNHSFSNMLSQTQQCCTKPSSSKSSGSSSTTSSMSSSVSPSISNTSNVTIQGVTQTKATTLEEMLRAKYPNLKYHVFDASSSYWRTRNDYPHYLLYQDDIDTEALENWKPTGENPFYGSIDGRFTAPKEIKALNSVPVGTVAVVIHPKVQQKMENDPEYAKEIYDRINKWFEFDIARNEAIIPGITARSSRSIAIGEDGEIVNAQSHSQGSFSYSESGSKSGTDMALDFWTARSLRHKYFMQLQLEGQLRHEMLLYGLTGTPNSSGLFDLAGGTLSAANLAGLMKLSQSFEMPSLSSWQLQQKAEAKAKLSAMMNSGELSILGSSISGTSLQDLILMTKQESNFAYF